MVYAEAPWVFKGKHTLGGFYLARYDDSPAGAFDELVAMAGLVWNPPTSCAWAARVYVNNRLATFKLTGGSGNTKPGDGAGTGSRNWWWRPGQEEAAHHPRCCGRQHQHQQQQEQQGGSSQPQSRDTLVLSNVDCGRGRGLSSAVCRITMPDTNRAWGPRITLSLPSFSGATPEVPGLLRYACDLQTNVGLLAPLAVEVPAAGRGEEDSREHLGALLGGRPLVTLEFAQMEMHVEEPEALLVGASAQQQQQQQLETVVSQRWAGARAASLTAAWAGKTAKA
ncbi:hypothetical protein VOLCADRAFT_98268 [Volvox carteri f. nagariensis]|uniref:Uncharacterized protein n=1 Tax=Volvox carteri f. nagariensis TaxID=3068 RepID=D8UF08_VOLCA|nr:uncharacterized protein VOLCADRAFT_98268 [Volvox carteri f. nagariensis]EFJ41734.1 hypothetical protein VOLCADRAFT_98268 [Volvox carteri f. nagariensis]|eukprot:XP_002957236.1 hypothetical protein VOLCADRAFT_98268 [Volvox carteri f. nagariensis]